MKIKNVLKKGIFELNMCGIEDASWKIKLLMMHELNVSNEYLAIHGEDEMSQQVMEQFEKHQKELLKGKPVQYITNSQDFFGLNFYVDENVLIPQPDTEILVEETIAMAKEKGKKCKILDLCTGSGAIAVAIAKYTNAQLQASDISQKALEIAKKNALKQDVSISFVQSDMFEKIEGKFDLIVSNPPYIETEIIETLSDEVKNEPKIALDGGRDGLKFYRILAEETGKYLRQDGRLILEIGYQQKERVMQILEKAGFCEVYAKRDLGNHDRMVVGKWR